MTEAPLAIWSVSADATNAEKQQSFDAMIAKLPSHVIDTLLSLSQSGRYGERQSLLGTWQTNGLPINYESTTLPGTTTRELLQKKDAAVFETVCRLNHSCAPNCHAEWDGRLGTETVHALFDIPAGDELTISYLSPRGRVRRDRQAQLLADHGFTCNCAKCALSGEDLASSEARQRALSTLCPPSAGALPLAERVKRVGLCLRLLEEESLPALWAWKPELYHLVAGATAELRRDSSRVSRERLAAWAERARKDVGCAQGAEHPAVQLLASLCHKLRTGLQV